VALYLSYLRVGARGDLAIQYMRQIADDLDAISKTERTKSKGHPTASVDRAAALADQTGSPGRAAQLSPLMSIYLGRR
jgi:hypothetical protein